MEEMPIVSLLFFSSGAFAKNKLQTNKRFLPSDTEVVVVHRLNKNVYFQGHHLLPTTHCLERPKPSSRNPVAMSTLSRESLVSSLEQVSER